MTSEPVQKSAPTDATLLELIDAYAKAYATYVTATAAPDAARRYAERRRQLIVDALESHARVLLEHIKSSHAAELRAFSALARAIADEDFGIGKPSA